MPYKFIDLFAGLGGFNLALKKLDNQNQCVFASELREDLRKLYSINFPGVPIVGDITHVDIVHEIPPHDILCAGFPCQPFSQAGKQLGFKDEDRGNLFFVICDIIRAHRPKYILLENVANLKGHDHGDTWRTIKKCLEDLHYDVPDPEILSPHQFSLPQHRKRIYIVAVDQEQGGIGDFKFPAPRKNARKCNIREIINESDTNITKLKSDTRHQLKVWQDFLDQVVSHGHDIPRFPIWAMEFGADYPYEDIAPAKMPNADRLIGKKGKLGRVIREGNLEDCLLQLPKYAQTDTAETFPVWKKKYIRQNREFYEQNKEWLDEWLRGVMQFENSHLKFEWNCGIGKDIKPIIEDKIVQFRASGIRVKKADFSPALNLVGTQVPILPWVKIPEKVLKHGEPDKGRYMTVSEAAKLQGMGDLKFSNDEFTLSQGRCYEALGNAINVDIVYKIAKNLIK